MGIFDNIKTVMGGSAGGGLGAVFSTKGGQKGFGQFTGFGGSGGIDPQEVDPGAYSDLYEKALAGVQSVGNTGKMPDIRNSIESSALSYLKDLDNNAAGRKANFLEDQSRAFGADTQNLARARGGTGTLAQVLKPSGAMYDSQSRATARGLVDLQGQAVKDLGSLSGIQGNLQEQDQNKQSALASIYGNELNARRGIAADNSDRRYNAGTERYNRQASTVNAASKIGGKFVGGGAS